MLVLLGIFYGVSAWICAILYALLTSHNVVVSVLLGPIIVSAVTAVVCFLGVMLQWARPAKD